MVEALNTPHGYVPEGPDDPGACRLCGWYASYRIHLPPKPKPQTFLEAAVAERDRLRAVLASLAYCAEQVARAKGYLQIEDPTALGRAFVRLAKAVEEAKQALGEGEHE